MTPKKSIYSSKRLVFFIIAILSYFPFYGQINYDNNLREKDSLKRIIAQRPEESTLPLYHQLSLLYRTTNTDSALMYSKKTKDLAIKHNNTKYQCEGFRAIGELYLFQSKYNKAKNYLDKALKVIEKTKDSSLYGYITMDISNLNYQQGNFDIALQKLKAVQKYALYNDDTYLSMRVYLNLTNIFTDINLIDDARFFTEKGLELSKKINDGFIASWFYYNQAKLLEAEGNYNEAIDLLNNILINNEFIEIDAIDFKVSALNAIANCYYLKKEYPTALNYVLEATNLFTDDISIFNRKKSRVFHTVGSIYLKLGDYINAEKYLYKSLNLAKKKNEKPILLKCYKDLYTLSKLKNKNKESLYYLEQHLSLMKIKTNTDLSNSIISIKTVDKFKEYDLKLRDQKLKLEERMKLTIFERNLIITVFIILSFLLLMLYKNRLAINQKLIFSFKLRALRSQMNPHFIFNTLNGIQNYILNEDRISAYKQLTRFSKSMRYILNESDKDYIILESELEFIKDYIALEKIRFGSRLEFILEINNDVHIDKIYIPNFILQPIIENSIIHGISNKNEGGFVKLKLEKTTNQLTIKIEDNGIGRAASRKINQKINPEKKSIASVNIIERFKILKKNNKNQIDLKIIDLKNNTGTLVVIKLPIIPN